MSNDKFLNKKGLSSFFDGIKNLLSGKADKSHKHTKSDITDFPTLGTSSSKDVPSSGNATSTQVVMGNDSRLTDARKASDVSSWAKASTKPTYTASEVGLAKVGNFKAVSTVASQGLSDTEKSNARTNIGAQVAGSYAASNHSHSQYLTSHQDISGKQDKSTAVTHTASTAVGSATQPVYIASNGTATATTYTLGKSVPSNAVFTDTNTWRPQPDWNATSGDAMIKNKPSTFTPSSHTHAKSQITDFPTSMPASDVYSWAKASSKPSYTKSEVGLGNVDNTADSAKSVKYATSAGSASKATGVVDYGATAKTIQIGYSGDGISGDAIKFIAGYTTGNGSDVDAKIKDVSKDALKSWLGLGSLAYSSAAIPTIPSSLPANGGTATTISQKVNASSLSHTNYNTNGTYVPTMNFLSYWNGAYSSSGASNLSYCKHGAFGTIVTKSASDFATANHTHSNYLTGINSTMITKALDGPALRMSYSAAGGSPQSVTLPKQEFWIVFIYGSAAIGPSVPPTTKAVSGLLVGDGDKMASIAMNYCDYTRSGTTLTISGSSWYTTTSGSFTIYVYTR